jgi:hypothetical protein
MNDNKGTYGENKERRLVQNQMFQIQLVGIFGERLFQAILGK